MIKKHWVAGFVVLLMSSVGLDAMGQEFGAGSMDRGTGFAFESGEQTFRGLCQGCHMKDAGGATGSGTYPALAHNKKLAEAGYPVSVVLHGQKAMPAFGSMLSDRQVADVVNYIRRSFGNSFKGAVMPGDVKAAR